MTMTSPVGRALHDFASELYPICRSITGNGVRQTLRLIGQKIPLAIREVPSGTKVFDWEVPLEWNIEDAWIVDPQGRRLASFQHHNLHIVNYSEPVDTVLDRDAVVQKLHSLPDRPDWIPYRTSYYKRQWGFCIAHREVATLGPGRYGVRVDSNLAKGALTYGEFELPGKSREEVLLFTHICHPSLANDNASGMAIVAQLAGWLATEQRRYTYRIVFAPGTIGSLCWLRQNEKRLARVRHGLVLGLLGDPGPHTYKRSRRGDCAIDRIVPHVLRNLPVPGRVIPFEPYGYDERQLCSPGFNLPVGRLTRSVNDGYREYHTSADNLDLITPQALEHSLEVCKQIVETLESDRRYINVSPRGEPRLGKRGLYGAMGGRSPAEREHAMLWVLNQSDGAPSLLEIAEKSGLKFRAIAQAAAELVDAKLLRPCAERAPAKRAGSSGKVRARSRTNKKGPARKRARRGDV